jgi:type IV conjugative transfer system protein TraL
MYQGRIPKRLDQPKKMVLFDAPSIFVGTFMLMLFYANGQGLLGLIVGLITAFSVQKVKDKQKKRGAFWHMVYWFTGIISLKRTPPSSYRSFRE